jgi:acyl-CoA synthetase (AMP-forming)/AMP-acid ligase II
MPDRLRAPTVATLFDHRARLRPDGAALFDARGRHDAGTLRRRVQRVAGLLRDRGVGPGDRVALLAGRRGESLEVALAALWLGAIVAVQDESLSPEQLDRCLQITEARVIVGPRRQAGRVLHRLEPVVAFGDRYEAELHDVEPVEAPLRVEPDDIALLGFTSPTRGAPLAAAISHGALLARDASWRATHALSDDGDFVLVAPVAHVAGLEPVLGTWVCGGAVHLLDEVRPDAVMAVLHEHRVGWLPVPPGMTRQLVESLARSVRPVRGVELCGQLYDAVPDELASDLARLLDAPFVDSFASPELGLPTLSASRRPAGAWRPTGKRAAARVEWQLCAADGSRCGPGEAGELCLRSATLFSGYWGDVEATAEAFRGGWYHTGHRFRIGPDGGLLHTPREVYQVRSGEMRYRPEELEAVLLAMEGVVDAAVVSRPDEVWGSVPVAVVATEDPRVSREGVLAAARRWPAHQRPRDVVLVRPGDIPRSASGLLQHRRLEAMLSA